MEDLKENILIKDRYRLVRKLGEGSFGEVWLASDTLLSGMQVALKFYQRTDVEGQENFTREYTRVQHLKHDNLLTATYFDFYMRRPFLVMDYCAEGAASRLKGHMNEQQIWRFVHDVAAGLAYMHQQTPPIIHQDIKPGNVLLHGSGRFVVTDFGISRSTLSASGSSEALKSAGTVAYMGPERFSANAETIMASDLWSLGASIYEMATGNYPFEGRGGVALKMGFEMPDLPVGFSRQLDALMKACMARETWDRPRASQVADYAAAIMRGEKPSVSWKVSKAPGPSKKHPAGLSKGGKYWKWGLIGAGCVVVVLLVVLLVRIPKSSDDDGPLPEQMQEKLVEKLPQQELSINQSTVETDEGTWTGGIKDGKPEGEGTLTYPSDDPDGRQVYIGEMHNGKRHGQGVLRYRNGNSFEGEFRWNQLHNGTFLNLSDDLAFTGLFSLNEPLKGEWRFISTGELYETVNP